MKNRFAAAFCCLTLILISAAAAAEQNTESLASAQSGETVVWGAYEQDNDESNGPEPVEWLVLENTGDTLLLNSVCALDCRKYHDGTEAVTWETCDLRAWLNGEFYETCFSSGEKERILLNHLENPASERYDIAGGNPTDDYVYILSTQEQSAFFADEADMAAFATPYAIARGVQPRSTDEPYARYWLRNPGMTGESAAFLQYDFLNYSGTAYAKVKEYAVRPVIRLDLSGLE